MARSDFTFFHTMRVRWSEVDAQGVVFNGHYLNYFDVAQTEFLRAAGCPYPDGLRELGTDLYLVRATLELHGPVGFDDEIEIGVRASKFGRTSVTFAFEVFVRGDAEAGGEGSGADAAGETDIAGEESDADSAGSADARASGESVYVNVETESRKAAPLPEALIAKIRSAGSSS